MPTARDEIRLKLVASDMALLRELQGAWGGTMTGTLRMALRMVHTAHCRRPEITLQAWLYEHERRCWPHPVNLDEVDRQRRRQSKASGNRG